MIFSLLPVTALNVFGSAPTFIDVPASVVSGSDWAPVAHATGGVLRVHVTNSDTTLTAPITVPVLVDGSIPMNATTSGPAVTVGAGFIVDLVFPNWLATFADDAMIRIPFESLGLDRGTAASQIRAAFVDYDAWVAPAAGALTGPGYVEIPAGVGPGATITTDGIVSVVVPSGTLNPFEHAALGAGNAHLLIRLSDDAEFAWATTSGAITVVGHPTPNTVGFTVTPTVEPGVYRLEVIGSPLYVLPAAFDFSFAVHGADFVQGESTFRVYFDAGLGARFLGISGPIALVPAAPPAPPTPPTAITIPPGDVRNAISEPDRYARAFQLTVNMNQLHTHINDQSAVIDFLLDGPDSGVPRVRFMGGEAFTQTSAVDNRFQTARVSAPGTDDAGRLLTLAGVTQRNDVGGAQPTPIIRVHEDSQLFIHGQFVQHPERLFSSQGPGMTADGRLSVIQPTNAGRDVRAWLSLSSEGSAFLNYHGFTGHARPDNIMGVTALGPGRFVPAPGGGGTDRGLAVSTATGTNAIHGLTGTLVLEVIGIAAASDNTRITARRVGGIGGAAAYGTTLVNNQLLTFVGEVHGINWTVGSVRNFSTGLMLDHVRMTERRPQSFHQIWNYPDAQGGSAVRQSVSSPLGGETPHQIRLLGPRDFVWNLGGDTIPGAGGPGLPPIGTFTMVHNGVFDTGAENVIDPSTITVSQFIDPPTGRPALLITFDAPDRRVFPAYGQIGWIELRNLALVPTRDGLTDDIYVDASFGEWQGVGLNMANVVWSPIPSHRVWHAGDAAATPPTAPQWIYIEHLTAAQSAALHNLGRGILPNGQPRGVANSVMPTELEVRTALNVSLGTTTTPTTRTVADIDFQILGLSWMQTGGEVVATGQNWRRRQSNWQNTDLLVGRRAENALVLRAGEDARTLVSGQLGLPEVTFIHGGDHPWDNNATNNAVANSRTARIEIEELSPGAFNTGWADGVINLNIAPTEGVQIMHAAWRIWSASTAEGVRTPGTHGWQQVPFRDDDTLDPVGVIGVPTLTRDSLRLFIPRIEGDAAARNATRTLTVVFYVSILAGYEHLIGEPITVVASGPAVANLAVDNREVTIAYVEDPISVELLSDRVHMEVGQVMTPFEITPISDIRITERERGTLTRGTQLRIGIEADPIPVLGGHALVNTQVILDDSGLEIRATQRGTGQNAYILLEVIRESQVDGASFTLTNNAVMGTFIPAIRYGVSVNAIPVAANPVPARYRENPIAQNTARGLTGRGHFDAIPYFVEVVTFEGFVYEGLPPGVGIPGPGLAPGANLRFWEGMSAMPTNVGGEFHLVQDPFTFVYTTPDLRVAMLNPRVFADIIGGELTYGGTPMQITFNGPSAMGDNVTVTLTVGSTQAVVNGVTVDIAAFAGASGPAGSITTQIINDRSFVPLRFLATAFGYVVDASGFPVIELR